MDGLISSSAVFAGTLFEFRGHHTEFMILEILCEIIRPWRE